jgi:hypothetical protein
MLKNNIMCNVNVGTHEQAASSKVKRKNNLKRRLSITT